MKYFILSLFIISSISCDQHGECNVEKISTTIFDSTYVKGDYIMTNQKKEIDTLKFENYHDHFETSYYYGLMNHQECGHFIDYSYNFKGETIQIDIEKNEDELIFKAESSHMSNEQKCDKNSSFNNLPLIVDGQYCEQSIFNKIIFRKFKIESILTKNGDKWFPEKMIQRN